MKPPERRRVDVDNSWVTVDIYGDSDAAGLVMVPGVMSDALAWELVARPISSWPAVSVVNRRGRRPSGPMTDDYSLRSEVADLYAVLDVLPPGQDLFGWSFGGLIALLAADGRDVGQVIAYEPVIAPFGASAVTQLRQAHGAGDWDRTVDIVNREISGFPAAAVEELRADRQLWDVLRRLSEPLSAEIAALNSATVEHGLARRARRVDLIIGEMNQGRAPYGASFEDVRRFLTSADVHQLPGAGHLAHLDDPAGLAELVNTLADR